MKHILPLSPFSRFVAAAGLTNLADGVATVVWAWMATLLTRDAFLIALMPVALRLPWFVFALPAGVITDRVDRHRLIVAMDVLRAFGFAAATVAVVLAMPLADAPQTGLAQPGLFYMLLLSAVLVGSAEVFRDNAAQTMLPSLVPHERLEAANGRLWSVELVGNSLIGPALGAFLIATIIPMPFALNAVAYVAALWLVWPIKGAFKPEMQSAPNWRSELKEGFDFLRRSPLLRSMAWITGAWNLLFQMSAIALVLHVQENLNLGATAYGLLLAAGAVGGIAAGFVAENIIKRYGPMRTAQVCLVVSAPCFFGFAYAPNWLSLAAMIMVFEFSGLTWNTVSVSYRQRSIPDVLLGRVNSLYRMLAWGLMPIGLILSGLIVRWGETVFTRDAALVLPFYVASAGAVLVGVLGWRALGRGFSQS
ncbi:MFS transporter [Ascidiaceihabitans sp.]|uniref:MFS transporter n=1 Tax=Ascidiaceihabitans sp. TaxID=1872644 RepID=UPI00329746F0